MECERLEGAGLGRKAAAVRHACDRDYRMSKHGPDEVKSTLMTRCGSSPLQPCFRVGGRKTAFIADEASISAIAITSIVASDGCWFARRVPPRLSPMPLMKSAPALWRPRVRLAARTVNALLAHRE
jgi:hypothetical protein